MIPLFAHISSSYMNKLANKAKIAVFTNYALKIIYILLVNFYIKNIYLNMIIYIPV